MPKKIKDCTWDYLTGIPLPVHADTYTVISHENVMDYTKTALINAGFTIEREEYRATADGQIAQGVYRLHYGTDQELSMMLAWTNSYNKQVRFKCGVGAYINTNGTVMVCGEMGNWARKHTGTADTETIATITDQVANAHMYYNQLVSDKNVMQTISMTKRKQAQLLGILFAEYQILTTEQASIVRQQMDKPSYVFADNNSLWAFYNYVTLALQQSHPKTWMEDQRILHYFINSVNNFPVCSQPAQIPEDEVIVTEDTEVNFIFKDIIDAIDPNQISLLDQIADMEADMMDEDIRYAANNEEEVIDEIEVEELTLQQPEESILQYTDRDGNTFESIEFHNAAVESSLEPTPEEHELYEADLNTLETIVEEITLPKPKVQAGADFDLDFSISNTESNKEEDTMSDFF
ncbi:MAG: DUF932 domain-containing protein [Sphingobacteriia bacterium]|nr:DUF932 domain-containing protein [Candidatus Fonsibacter lacus]